MVYGSRTGLYDFFFYIGDLVQKQMQEDRLEQLVISETYYKDFLQRCKNYEITDVEIPTCKF